MPPGPRGSPGLSSASRPSRHTGAGPLSSNVRAHSRNTERSSTTGPWPSPPSLCHQKYWRRLRGANLSRPSSSCSPVGQVRRRKPPHQPQGSRFAPASRSPLRFQASSPSPRGNRCRPVKSHGQAHPFGPGSWSRCWSTWAFSWCKGSALVAIDLGSIGSVRGRRARSAP